jgi:hypothetical protein
MVGISFSLQRVGVAEADAGQRPYNVYFIPRTTKLKLPILWNLTLIFTIFKSSVPTSQKRHCLHYKD